MSCAASLHLTFASLGLLAVAMLITGCSGESDTSAAGGAGNIGGNGGSTSLGGSGGSGASGGSGGSGAASCGPETDFPDENLGAGDDPAGGVFTMEQALDALPAGPGPLRAIITTDEGELSCELRPDVAPNGVANFVGLARGQRPWLDPASDQWVQRPFYDGLLFHRVIPDFMAQGGDPLGTGYGGPGYELDDEIGTLSHVPGTLAYANAGPDTNGSQFYITETSTTHLDGDYTIIGLCEPVSVVQALTGVETNDNDRPLVDLHMQTIRITRCAP